MSTFTIFKLVKAANTNLTDEQAEQMIAEIEALVNQRFGDRKELLATKVGLASVKVDLIRNIYIASIAQILSILGGVFGILKLMGVL
jgi:hypothetical protein